MVYMKKGDVEDEDVSRTHVVQISLSLAVPDHPECWRMPQWATTKRQAEKNLIRWHQAETHGVSGQHLVGNTRNTSDHEQVDEIVLALLSLTLHEGDRAWKGFDGDALDWLSQKEWIENPSNTATSVWLTQEGLARSARLFEQHLGISQEAPDVSWQGSLKDTALPCAQRAHITRWQSKRCQMAVNGRRTMARTNIGRKNRSGLRLNLLIARSHQVATQLVGVQLSIANLLAIAVSAASVVAGTVTITMQRYPASLPLWIVAGVIGAGLALLIEGMTLGALIRIRLASKKIKAIDESLEVERDQIDWFALEKRARKAKEGELRWKRARATRQFRKMRLWSVPIVIVGSLASAVAGGMFYHMALAGLGEVESLVVAALFPFVVTCTFISSELFKDIQEEAIKEGYGGGGLADAALREETRRLSFQAVHDGMLHHFHDPDIQEELKLGTLGMLKDIIIDLRQTVSGTITAFQEGSASPPQGLLDPPPIQQQNDPGPILEPLQPAMPSQQSILHQERQEEPSIVSLETAEGPSDDIPTEDKTEDHEQISSQTTGVIALDHELLQVLEHYPKIATLWLATNRKSAPLEEIVEVTGHGKRRLSRAPLQRTSRNKDLIRINSVLTWLKTAPLPARKQDHSQVIQTEPIEEDEEHAASNGHSNGHAKADDLVAWWLAKEE